MSETTTKTYSFIDIVKELEGDGFLEKPIAYEFNGGRKVFKSKGEFGGVYYTAPPPPP